MKKKKRIVLLVFVLIWTISIAWLSLSAQGLRILAAWWLPEYVRIDTINGRAIGPVRLNGLQVNIPGASIQAGSVEFDWSPAELLYGQISIKPLEIAGLKIETNNIETNNKEQAITQASFVLPFKIEISQAHVRHIVVNTKQDTWQANSIIFTMSLDAQQLNIHHIEIESDLLWASGEGQLPLRRSRALNFDLDWKFLHSNWPEWTGRTHVSGTYENLRIEHAGDTPIGLRAHGSAQLLGATPVWQIDLDIAKFIPAAIRQTWPQQPFATQIKLQGRGQLISTQGLIRRAKRVEPALEFDGKLAWNKDRIVVQQFEFGLAETPARANMAGEISLSPRLQLSARGEWQALQWPVTGTPRLYSEAGRYRISGAPAAYTGRLSAKLSNSGMFDKAVEADVEMTFTGGTGQVDVSVLQVRNADGLLSGKARVDWREAANVQAKLHAQGFNPAVFTAKLAGKLDFDLAVEATWPLIARKYRVTLENLKGVVNGQAVSGHAGIHTLPGGDISSQVDLRMGENTLVMTGVTGNKLDLVWKLEAHDLAGIWPDTDGQLSSQGQLSGSVDIPRIDMSITSGGVRWQDVTLAGLRAHIGFELASGEITNTQAYVQGLQWRELDLGSLAITVDGTVMHHSIDMALQAADGSATLRAEGGYNNEMWRGRMMQAVSRLKQAGPWRLEAPVAVDLGWQKMFVASACLSAPPARVCIAGLSLYKGVWKLDAKLRQVSLQRFAAWLPAEYSYKGQVNADVGLVLFPHKPWQGQAKLRLTNAELLPLDELKSQLKLSRVKLNSGELELAGNNTELTFHGTLDLGPAGNVTARIRAGRLSPHAPVSGTIQGKSIKLDALGVLVPELSNSSGDLLVDLGIGGTVAAPGYSGRIALVNGSAVVTSLGISLENIGLDLDGRGTDLQVRGSARSGEGVVQLNGTLDWSGRQLLGNLALLGKRFRITDREEGVKVDASPNLALKITGRELELTGNVHIDKAHIGGVKVGKSRITTSTDEVIISEKPGEPMLWRVTSRIDVTLGDISIDAYGLSGKARGALKIIDRPGQPVRSTGELAIDKGSYQAFGAVLDIEYARLSFSGGPINNPGIDVRAVRRLESVTAGVKVRGRLMDPQLTVFSIPPRSHRQALALLVIGEAPIELGRPSSTLGYGSTADLMRKPGFGGNSSVTGIPLDTYLSPDFYVGILESFSMRYRISKKWSVEMQRGIESSLGITYSIQ